MNNTKLMTAEEIITGLIYFYTETHGVESEKLTDDEAIAHLIELVESNKPICYQGEASVEAIIYAIKKLAQYEQALIKAIEGDKENAKSRMDILKKG